MGETSSPGDGSHDLKLAERALFWEMELVRCEKGKAEERRDQRTSRNDQVDEILDRIEPHPDQPPRATDGQLKS